ncbi:hypothetical protein F5Y12DRAFT_717924 [Xylaria sp. FL1777]|nr:hypothetical protein F5Y12DRAFT_717924 [Xylaria sp. FL1777]
MDGCSFQSDTERGIHEHRKNKHLGTKCYWPLQNGGICNHQTQTHERLYNHINGVHLGTKCNWPLQNGGICNHKAQTHEKLYDHLNSVHLPEREVEEYPYPCRWPGCVDSDETVTQPKTFEKLGSAERHAREHQYKIWRTMEPDVEPREGEE